MDIRDSYDSAAEAYDAHFASELTQKPLDRHLLNRFAEAMRGRGPVADLGCGPGHVTRYLHDQDVEIIGLDISPEMIRVANARNPGIDFRVDDMNSLALPDGSLAGAIAFYSIVHLEAHELAKTARELRRAIVADGLVLVAFHVGNEVIHGEELFGAKVSLDFHFFESREVVKSLESAHFKVIEHVEREPYAGAEHPSRRCYLLARAAN